MSFATDLSNKINELQYDALPAEAVHWAKVGILDTVGVTIAGAAEDATRILLGVSGSSSGPSLVFGHARRIGALDAALVNGTASHALDFDDCNNTLGGHPSVPILPALFALADETGASGTDFIAAYVAAGGDPVDDQTLHYFKVWALARNASAANILWTRFSDGLIDDLKVSILPYHHYPRFIGGAAQLIARGPGGGA